MSDIYNQQIAKARTSFTGGRFSAANVKQKALYQPADRQGKSFAEQYAQNRVQSAVNNYLNNKVNSYMYPNTYGSVNSGYMTAGNGGSQYWAGDAPSAGNTSSSGGAGNALAAVAILQAALKVRGQKANKETGEELPWEEKNAQQRTTSAPGTAGALFPLWLIGNLKGDRQNPEKSSNAFSKALNFMGEAEYKAVTPLYDFFVKGPQQIGEPVGGYDLAFSGFDD